MSPLSRQKASQPILGSLKAMKGSTRHVCLSDPPVCRGGRGNGWMIALINVTTNVWISAYYDAKPVALPGSMLETMRCGSLLAG